MYVPVNFILSNGMKCDFCGKTIPPDNCRRGYCPYCGSLIRPKYSKKAFKEGLVISIILLIIFYLLGLALINGFIIK